MKKILYVGFIGKGNLGDDMMWDVFHDTCHSLFPNHFLIHTYTPGQKVLVNDYDAIVLGGGSIIGGKYLDILTKAMNLEIPIFVWGSGVDKLSKKKMNTFLYNKETKFNYILPKETEEKLKKIIPYAKKFGVRGPLTQASLEHLQKDSEKFTFISGDPGLLLTTKEQSATINRVEENKFQSPTIAVNWGTDFNRIYGKDEKGLKNQLVKALKEIHLQGYEILLYSVWKRDHTILQEIKDELEPDVKVNVIWEADQNEMMDILSKCVYSINFKLHANLLSLAAGTPCVALGYRFKVYDFFHSIDLPSWVLSANTKTLYQDILTHHEMQKKYGSDMIAKYQQHRELYKKQLLSILNDLKDCLYN